MSGDDEREFDAESGFEATTETVGGGDDAATGGDPDAATVRIRKALAEVRREGRKVAFLYAALDAALVALVVNVTLRLFRPAALGDVLTLPAALAGAGGVVPRTIHAAAVVGLALGAVTFAAEYVARSRRPLVEQFESANPAVRESLRTARDTVDDGANTDMARRLYEDVLSGLRETSTFELVGTRRVVVTTLFVVLVSLASIQVAVVDLDLTETLDGRNGQDDDVPSDRQETEREDDELQDGDQILGDPENVTAGDESINASVQGSESGEGQGGSTAPPSAYDDGGFSDAAVESQDAGYAESENVEDAELIREYNLQIRENDDEDDETS
ncbi:DUF7502 family protein [Halogeometricum limi]|uniref:Uncharacterized protein n=1 Tax=Halogeometricum limi TaxID=555875 RepID=A0A1I6GMW9_9EURY|nr:hypothetical protein [Halogeometricum limi]SFR43518.1 hypothetical protein SAMN04488124_1287 [Halogeometricum limi]